MSSSPFNWSKLIAGISDESFGIPPDVTFHIVEEAGEKRKLREVKAHKMILGMVSPTFMTMFYSTDVGDKTADVIKTEKTTAPAFTIMMEAVYNVKSIGDSLEGKSVHEVFDVVNLIERYQISELINKAKEHLAAYPVTDDTVLEVAGDAMEYTKLFEAEAQLLLLKCAKFIKNKLKDVNSMIRYASENRGEVFSVLLDLMNGMIPTECPNCKKKICKDGEGVKDEEFGEGLVVTNNPACGYWGMQNYGTGMVTNVEATCVTVELIKPGIGQFAFDGTSCQKTWSNILFLKNQTFLFSCN